MTELKIVDYFDLLGNKRMKTFTIKILASITDEADKEGENVTPVVISVPVVATNKKDAEKIFASTFSKMMVAAEELQQKEIYARMKEMTMSLEPPQIESSDEFLKRKWYPVKDR